eukprot:7559413-Alexandrium_andersonii.AAC.1
MCCVSLRVVFAAVRGAVHARASPSAAQSAAQCQGERSTGEPQSAVTGRAAGAATVWPSAGARGSTWSAGRGHSRG